MLTWVDGSARVMSHVNAQLVEVEKRLVTLGARMLLLLVFLRHVKPEPNTALDTFNPRTMSTSTIHNKYKQHNFVQNRYSLSILGTNLRGIF